MIQLFNSAAAKKITSGMSDIMEPLHVTRQKNVRRDPRSACMGRHGGTRPTSPQRFPASERLPH
ncbi:hypothetical protein HETIRDRAFT_477117 [Heterobasidion irregulare TC 32-1]|uniref:Uncharacterized protein n=1 Tax=Heterobasidion irregulare (strain TC 32-1) TaxID=747525 RepID=W4K2F6_HETIT|nr:uncharacterized protein HETIRDRAFT_477117 [Heterobasidion irregulare TC 32-1]ETW79530.1 hypothetical protein HETIRDRAFT_477117 [Heterobasidion irregulare TC 32-1]